MPVFEDATKPVVQRENEFRDVVKFLADNDGTVKSYTIAGKTLEESLSQAEIDKRKMAEAGNELTPKRTIRTRNEPLDDKKSVKVYLWATKKIARKPKPVVAATPAPVAATDSKAAPKK
jgi:hypothetical protein